jgi:hypothetical protein
VKRGRPARKLAATIRQVEQLLNDEPGISAAAVALRLGLRKQTAQIIVSGLRARQNRFPNSAEAA